MNQSTADEHYRNRQAKITAGIPACRRVVAFRNQLARGYFAIRHDVVWSIATNDLSRLLGDLRAALQRFDSE